MADPTPSPARPAIAGGASGLGLGTGGVGIGVIAVWVIETYYMIEIPAQVALAIGSVLAGAVAYIVRER